MVSGTFFLGTTGAGAEVGRGVRGASGLKRNKRSMDGHASVDVEVLGGDKRGGFAGKKDDGPA